MAFQGWSQPSAASAASGPDAPAPAVALADRHGTERAAEVLAAIDEYYADLHQGGSGVASQLVRQLADPRPADPSVTQELPAYRNLDPRWTDWAAVRRAAREIAVRMLDPER